MFTFLIETILLGLKNLRLHKLRTLLTAMGIIIGVAAVIIMVGIGEGAKQSAMEQLQKLGARNIVIRSTPPPDSGDATGRQQRALIYGLRRADLARLETLPGLDMVVPLRDTMQKVVHAGIRANANAIGTTPDVFTVVNLRLARGRYFNWVDYDKDAPVCVIGALAAQQLFPYQDPLGETIQVGVSGMSVVMLTIVGVLEPTGLRAGSDGSGVLNRDLDSDIYFPWRLARSAFGDNIIKRDAGSFERKQIELSEIWLQAQHMEDVEEMAALAENVIRVTHSNTDFVIKAPISILRAAEQQQRTFNFVMVAIAAGALIVGGIGIMNIMLASVTERTREIGIRRALGAKRRDITLQFLIETTVISLTGGLLGIGLGAGAATLLPIIVRRISQQSYPTSITAWSVVGSFAISGMIGIGFGLYPAVMAARMNPIEALRHE